MPQDEPLPMPAHRAIEEALRTLPIAPPKSKKGVPYAMAIPAIAHQVMVMRRPNELEKMHKKAEANFARIVKAAHQLEALIDKQFPEERQRSLDPGIRVPALLTLQGVMDMVALRTSLKQFGAIAKHRRSPLIRRVSRGRPPKNEALAIALYLYEVFVHLTGRVPTRIVRNGKTSGEFQTLLQTVFTALGLKASPEAMAAKAMSEMKKRRSI